MTLGNILTQAGGIAETGRPVRFQVRVKRKDGTTVRHWADAVLLPVSEQERADANSEASAHCAEHESADPADERVYRFVQKALRDPDKPAVLFVPNDKMEAFRAAVTREQVDWLCAEYKKHIQGEYSELLPRKDAKSMEDQAEGFTSGGPR